jgi:hypothetical protein
MMVGNSGKKIFRKPWLYLKIKKEIILVLYLERKERRVKLGKGVPMDRKIVITPPPSFS